MVSREKNKKKRIKVQARPREAALPSTPRSANPGDDHGREAAHFDRQRWACFEVSGTQGDQIFTSVYFAVYVR